MERSAIVLAGGLGTRIRAVTGGRIPKAMVPVNGRPFIDYKLISLRRMGVTRVIMLIGVGADQIVEHVTGGVAAGLEVEFREDGPQLLGTAGSIRNAVDTLPERFWVTYGDSLVTADLAAGEQLLLDRPADAVMTVFENHDRWDPSNVGLDDGRVAVYDKGAAPGTLTWIDYGLICFARQVFAELPVDVPTDLGVVVRGLVADHRVMALPVSERFWEVGSPGGLEETEGFVRSTPELWSV